MKQDTFFIHFNHFNEFYPNVMEAYTLGSDTDKAMIELTCMSSLGDGYIPIQMKLKLEELNKMNSQEILNLCQSVKS